MMCEECDAEFAAPKIQEIDASPLCPGCKRDADIRGVYAEEMADRRPRKTPLIENFDYDRSRKRAWIANGFQEVEQPKRRPPEWLNNESELRRVILAHPQARNRAEKWALMLFYTRIGWSAKDIAEQLCVSVASVKKSLSRLKRRAAKLAAVHESVPDVSNVRAAELFQAGQTVRAVASELGVSVGKAAKLRRRWRDAA